MLVFQGDLQASIEASALQNQGLQERASKLKLCCDLLVVAMMGHCNTLQTALETFRSSCYSACEDAGMADSQSNLLASVKKRLSFALTDNIAAAELESGSQSTAETRLQDLPEGQSAADALQRLAVVMQNACSVFNTLTDFNLHAEIQKRDSQILELGQKVVVGNSAQNIATAYRCFSQSAKTIFL